MNSGLQDTAIDLPLRDIHFPAPITWWPLAPGWWLLLLLIMVVIGLALFWLSKTRKQRQLHKAIKSEFRTIEATYQQQPNDLLLANTLSTFLRRVSISTAPREESASLTGHAWLEHLDSKLSGQEFSTGAGRCLLEAPYNPATNIDAAALLTLCRRWVYAAI